MIPSTLMALPPSSPLPTFVQTIYWVRKPIPFMEVEAVSDESEMYASRLFPALVEHLLAPAVVPVLVALGLVTAFVHYTLDRAVYRMSDPEVRRAAHGLLSDRGGSPPAR